MANRDPVRYSRPEVLGCGLLVAITAPTGVQSMRCGLVGTAMKTTTAGRPARVILKLPETLCIRCLSR